MEWMWPEIFKNPSMDYYPELSESDRRGVALADQYDAWGLCYAGASQPDNFGEIMVKLSEISGAVTPAEVSKAANEWLASH